MTADIRFAPSLTRSSVTALAVDRLVVDASDGTRLIDQVSLAVAAGSLVAIAGPTGAGKTSLAAAVAGAIPITSGAIVIGGEDISRLGSSQRGIGYVPQDDALHGELSVRRTLEYAAALRLPDLDAHQRADRVASVLSDTRLEAHVDTVVGSLSVGQRKRVSIAAELLSRPPVLILDEPTSSLDPGYEATVMSTLRRLADLGHCVVVVTHSQPVISMCDRVLLLATGGRLAYFGATTRMHSAFGTSSPAELFTRLDDPVNLIPAQRSPEPVRALVAKRRDQVVGGAVRAQFMTLVRRYVATVVADRRRTTLFAVQAFVLGGLLLAFVASHGLERPKHNALLSPTVSATGVGVLLVTCATWLGMSNAIREIVKERRILVRERRAGLSAVAYVGSKIAFLGPLVAVQAAVLTVIAVQRQRVPGHGAVMAGVAEIAVTMALTGICAVTLALFVSATVRSADKALALLPMIVVVEFVLSGLRPAVSWPGLSHLQDLAASHWAVQAIQATSMGDARSWWTAIGALVAISAVALVAALVATLRSLRTPTVRHRYRSTLRSLATGAVTRVDPEMARLVRIGGGCLAAVALVVTGARIAVPFGPSAAAPAAVSHPAAPAADHTVVRNLPGVIGNVWWLLSTGTTLSIDMTKAAYAASSPS